MNNHSTLGVIGISHKTAPVEVRDLVALNEEEQKYAINKLRDGFDIEGIMILSTCNRTEIYLSGDLVKEEIPKIQTWLDQYKSCRHFTDPGTVYVKTGSETARHFYSVISGIDSQIVGELQITGQVKDSYNLAHDLGSTDSTLNKMYNFGMQAKKKVRNETFLSDGTVSVSFAGVELARKIFNNLADKRILLVGAGKTAELAAFHFMENDVESINVVNRTLKNAEELARKLNGSAFGLSDLPAALREADIVISATSSQDYVITYEMMAQISKNRHYDPIFLIDLAIPRDIDPKIEKLNNVYSYNLDDLNEIVETNLEKRKLEIPKANKIVSEFVVEFQQWCATNSMTTIISKLKSHFEKMSEIELARLKKTYPENGYREEIESYTENIVNKLVRQHMKTLKKNASDPDRYQQHVDLIFNLYEIDLD